MGSYRLPALTRKVTAVVGSPLSTAATFTPALSTTVANLRALRAMRDALRAADALAASMREGNYEGNKRWMEEDDDGEHQHVPSPSSVPALARFRVLPRRAANSRPCIPLGALRSSLIIATRSKFGRRVGMGIKHIFIAS